MDLGITSLLGASGLGMAAGVVKKIGTMAFQSWRASQQEKAEREEKRDALISNNTIEFQKVLNEKPITIEKDNEGKFNFKLWFIKFEWDWKSKGHDVAKNDARAARSYVIGMLAFTLCIVTIIFADNGLTPVWTTPANAEPSTTTWLWGFYSKTDNSTEVQILSGMGVAFLLCHGILTLITFWAVQAPLTYIKGRRS